MSAPVTAPTPPPERTRYHYAVDTAPDGFHYVAAFTIPDGRRMAFSRMNTSFVSSERHCAVDFANSINDANGYPRCD